MIFHTGGTSLTTGTFLIAMFMSLFVIYGFDTAGTLAEETQRPAPRGAEGDPRLDHRRVHHRRHLPLRAACSRSRTSATRSRAAFGPANIIDANFGNAFSTVFLLVVVGGDLRVLPVDP